MGMRMQITWALVADAGHARILERSGMAGVWLQIEALSAGHPPTHEVGRQRSGRVHESAGPMRQAIEPRRDLHEAAEAQFADLIARRVEDAAKRKGFDRLLLIAPSSLLGRLRASLGPAAQARLRADLDLDLALAPIEDIVAHLPEARPV